MEGPRKKLSGMFPTGSVSKKHLEEEIKAMSSVNAGMGQKLQELRNKLLQQQQLHQQAQRYRQDMEKDMSKLDGEISTLRDDKVTLHGQIHQLSEKLAAANKEIETLRNELETWTGHLFDSREEVLSAQAQIDALSATKKDMGQTISVHEMTISILNGEKKDLVKQIEYLEEMVAWFKKQHTVLKLTASDQYASMTAAESEVEPNVEGGGDRTAELQSRMKALRPENAFLKQTCVELRTEISCLRNNTPKTLRSLLVMRYLDTMYPLSTNEPNTEPSGQSETWFDDRTESNGPLETTYLLNLLQTSLDIVYSPAEFDEIAAILSPDSPFDAFYRRIQLRTCALCAKPRIGGDFHDSSLSWIDEFPARGNYFACYHAKVCRKCLIGYLIGIVQYEWWHHLGCLQWLFCPVAGCERALNIRCEADFQLCLEQNRDAEAEEHVKM
jgi:predicted  nucleic acid-binding Zn-ribbon protein